MLIEGSYLRRPLHINDVVSRWHAKKNKIQSAFVRTSLLVYQSGAEGVQLCVGVLPFGLEVVYPSRSLGKTRKGKRAYATGRVYCVLFNYYAPFRMVSSC